MSKKIDLEEFDRGTLRKRKAYGKTSLDPACTDRARDQRTGRYRRRPDALESNPDTSLSAYRTVAPGGVTPRRGLCKCKVFL